MKRYITIILLFAGLLLLFTTTNFWILWTSVEYCLREKASFAFSAEVLKARLETDDFAQKYFLLDLNGLYARLSGRRLFNQTILLKNGMLATQYVHEDTIMKRADMLVELGKDVHAEGIPFVFMLAPYKMPMDGGLLPTGLEDSAHKDMDAVMAVLGSEEIDTIDLRPFFCQTTEQVEQWFFRTDHHWKPVAALESLRLLIQHLQAYDSEITPELPEAKKENWSIQNFPGLFLGSQGRRTGLLFGGTDAMQVITPKFETELSLSVVPQKRITRGNYSDAELYEPLMDLNTDIHNSARYGIYTGGDYGVMLHRNAKAPIDRKILMIKDSFSLPLQTFLATVFREVDVIDPRRDNGFTVAEYIALTQPQFVIVELNPTMFLQEYYFEYGTFPNLQKGRTALDISDSFVIEPQENNRNCKVVYKGFTDKTAYRLHVDEINLSNRDAYGVSLTLDNANGPILRTIMDAEYCGERGCDWTFLTPEENSEELELSFCAGVIDHTIGIGASYSGVILEEYTE